MTVIVRFAPSPTGFLHIGGARTALFNYLFAKHHCGKFLLRIEDTDRARSTKEAVDAIINGLKWLGIDHDDEIVYQSSRIERHTNVALFLVELGMAYYCFVPQDVVTAQREAAISAGKPFLFESPWRDKTSGYPDGKPVIRLKAPRSGQIVINDLVQGEVVVECGHLDDLVLLRGDGSPTYNLSVVVDDHDMNITHIIRGDDHLTNAARQVAIYNALGWRVPLMAHLPLIHGPDGAKLSKRHGALSVESYKDMGYMPWALCNYLLRLGWSHGNDEIISIAQAIEWFDIDHIGRSPARMDFDKMKHINGHYIRHCDIQSLVKCVIEILRAQGYNVSDVEVAMITCGMNSLKMRASLLTDLAESAKIYLMDVNITFTDEAIEVIRKTKDDLVVDIINTLQNVKVVTHQSVQEALKKLAVERGVALAALMEPIRSMVVGRTSSSSVFEIIAIIGIDNIVARIQKSLKLCMENS